MKTTLKTEVLELLFKLFGDCYVQVNNDNMDLYGESPDSAIDHDLLIKRIKAEIIK